jgi:hypothetical protein
VKILLDECVDRQFARDLIGHEVTTAPLKGWAGIKNGESLALAEQEFDVFVTVDRKLASQQDLTKFQIRVLLIRARTTGSNTSGHSRPCCSKNSLRRATGALTILEA